MYLQKDVYGFETNVHMFEIIKCPRISINILCILHTRKERNEMKKKMKIQSDCCAKRWSLPHALLSPAHADCCAKRITSLALLIAWWIWKQRNACVFKAARPSVSWISSTIKEEARSWAHAGALGLCTILPEE